MDLKKEWKSIVMCFLSVFVVLCSIVIVLDNMKTKFQNDFPKIGEYCIDREGEQNIEHLNLEVVKNNYWNCSTCDEGICYVNMISGVSNAL